MKTSHDVDDLKPVLEEYGRYLSTISEQPLTETLVKIHIRAVRESIKVVEKILKLESSESVFDFVPDALRFAIKSITYIGGKAYEKAYNGLTNPGTIQNNLQEDSSRLSKIISNPNNVVVFLDKFRERVGRHKSVTSHNRNSEVSVEALRRSSASFETLLIERGFSEQDAKSISEIHSVFIEQNIPDASVIKAINELRQQFHSTPVDRKTPYPGRPVDPKSFLLTEYADEIQSGRLTSGRLSIIDGSLYQALYREVKADGIKQLVESKGKPYARRAYLASVVLGTSLEDAARFFGTLRADRMLKPETEKSLASR